MVLKIGHLEGCQFPMVANVLRYCCHMGNGSHRAELLFHQVNLPFNFCFDHLDIIFLADFFVDEVSRCSSVNHGVDVDCFFVAMQLQFDHNIVLIIFTCFRVVECRVVVCHHDGFPFWSVPQPISCWEHSSFPNCSATDSILISLIYCLPCHAAGFLAGCQFSASGLNDLGFPQSHILCPGVPHLRYSLSLLCHWNSSLEMLNRGCLLVDSKSIGSP